ncbi:metallophosphoesterase [Ornithinimicrobium sp. Y1694]|uniref:metallophosphoesterase n=1 Tax=Ornithinimicrobium sp. Y1694 TaxID=3418590 RepID=UPI003CF4CB5A
MTSPLLRTLGTGAALAGGAAAYATWIEPRWFALRRVEVPCLPAGSPTVRVLHVSDLHLVPRQHRKRNWVAGLADLAPDLVVNTGDNLADHAAIPAALDTFDGLLDLPGLFVMGSNDYFAPRAKNPLRYLNDSHTKDLRADEDEEEGQDQDDPRRLPTHELVRGFSERGWTNLNNRRARLEINGLDLEFVGVDDPHIEEDDYDSVSAPADPSATLTIGVAHAPYQRILDAMTRDGAQLLFAGHTHGGQLQIPGYGALVTNCDLDTGRVAGLSRWWPGAGSTPSSHAPPDAAWLHVSAGLGGNPYTPFRFSCRPEATLLTLVPLA